jgi:hypothetical protein
MLARQTDSSPRTRVEPEETPAQARRRTRGHVTSFGEGRVCEVDGCSTRLSRYNDATKCWTHEQEDQPSR